MKVLITGAGGTVGTAFIQLLSGRQDIIGIDHNETNVARLRSEGIDVRACDFTDFDFEGSGVDLVIHLAALKHIDLCEQTPSACISNNVIKTYELFRNARRNKADILFMSTDKAVEPNSTYGYSKALMEKMALELGGAFARSGNVLASSGSVLNIWDEAIENNQLIKVTHPEMRRFFITPENLVKRVWDLYLAGEKTIIPEMDMDTLIVDLLTERLSKHQYTMESYPGGVEITGLRPGEKLVEKLQ